MYNARVQFYVATSDAPNDFREAASNARRIGKPFMYSRTQFELDNGQVFFEQNLEPSLPSIVDVGGKLRIKMIVITTTTPQSAKPGIYNGRYIGGDYRRLMGFVNLDPKKPGVSVQGVPFASAVMFLGKILHGELSPTHPASEIYRVDSN